MVFGVGIDIEHHSRFLKYTNNEIDNEFLESIFSKNERANYAQFQTHYCYALSFSCKEAFFKAFGYSWNNSDMQWTNIELIFNDTPEKHKAEVYFSGFANKLIQKNTLTLPAKFNYSINNSTVIFEAVLLCQTK